MDIPALGPEDMLAARSVAGSVAVAVGRRRCIELLRGITSPDVYLRWASADGVADLRDRGGLDAHEGRTLAWVLAWAAAVETGWYSAQQPSGLHGRPAVAQRWSIRSGLLTSLIELAADGWVPPAAIDLVIRTNPAADAVADDAAVCEQLITARSWPAMPTPMQDLPNLPGAGPGEPVGARACLDVVADLAAEQPARRRSAARTVLGWADTGRLDDDEAAALGGVLSWVILLEPAGVRVDLLAALAALARRDRVSPWALDDVLTELPAAGLDSAEREVWSELAAALAAHRARSEGTPDR